MDWIQTPPASSIDTLVPETGRCVSKVMEAFYEDDVGAYLEDHQTWQVGSNPNL